MNHSIASSGAQIEYEWIPTAAITEQLAAITDTYRGFWIAPGVLESISGVLQIIQYARENNVPLIGTCGGFQTIMLEYAQNKLMLEEADHEEFNPDATTLVINKLTCSLLGQQGEVFIKSPSLVSGIYDHAASTVEQFRCSYGLNPEYEAAIHHSGLKIVGADAEGKPRIAELSGHRFFIGTLFVPQLSSTPEKPHCLVNAFVEQASHAQVTKTLPG
nr:hypothetical protein [Paenibacillus taihuensis]